MSSAAGSGTVYSMEGESSWIEMLMWDSVCVCVYVYSAIDKLLPEMVICQAANSICSGFRFILYLCRQSN